MGAQNTDPKDRNYDPEVWDDELPVHQEEVQPFAMGRYPVTVLNYLRFVEDGGYGQEQFWTAGGYGKFHEPANWQRQLRYPNLPVVAVSWFEAAAYCAWAGGRLPTEAEWEYAARGGREGVRYAWGEEAPDEHRANFHHKGPGRLTPVGLYPEGATPGGIQDLAGNCYEWVDDRWRDDYHKSTGPGDERVIRGGHWANSARFLRVSYRNKFQPEERSNNFGFRCVRDLPSP
jgi:formylglycine-generating enzyme required for sulfatase activity